MELLPEGSVFTQANFVTGYLKITGSGTTKAVLRIWNEKQSFIVYFKLPFFLQSIKATSGIVPVQVQQTLFLIIQIRFRFKNLNNSGFRVTPNKI